MTDVYQMVTDRIISQLEAGVVPWQRPWITASGDRGAYSFVTKRSYSLLNQMLLSIHGPGPYASLNQWNQKGCRVKTGEKGNLIVFWKWPDEQEDPDNKEKSEPKKARPVLRYYHVFHHSQVSGLSEEELFGEKLGSDDIPDSLSDAEDLLQRYVSREKIHLDMGINDRAFYSPTTDHIVLPSPKQFQNPEEYFATAFHELAHSTGAENRLNRMGFSKSSFGNESYSKEELIAEISSMQIMHTLGISTDDVFNNSAGYIDGWLKALKGNKRLIVLASGQAEKVTRFIMTTP